MDYRDELNRNGLDWDFACCKQCMRSSRIQDGHFACRYPSKEWMKKYEHGEATVLYDNGAWIIYDIKKEEISK